MYKVTPLIDVDRASELEVARYFYDELQRISEALQLVQQGQFLPELHVAPDKPRNGRIVYADGTDWNPGFGKGIYFYDGSAWQPLHT